MLITKFVVPAVILAAGGLVCTSSIHGTPAYAKKEKQSCTHCHTKVVGNKEQMTKNLNEVGTCYKDNDHSLAKCAAAK